MAYFKYRAVDVAGKIRSGKLEALHQIDLESQLSRLELTLISATLLKTKAKTLDEMPLRDTISFLFQLEMLLRAGVPMLSALHDLKEAAESDEGKMLSSGLHERIESGSSFTDALASYPGVFSEVVLNLVRAGEVSGQLPDVLVEIVRSLKWQDEMAAQTKKLLMYPSFVIVVIGAVVFFLMIYLVPQLVGFLENMGQEIPIYTKALILLSDIIVNYWWAILATPPILVVSIITYAIKHPPFMYQLHMLQLNLPALGPVIKKIVLARLADTFAMMYKTGIPIIEGLGYCQKVSPNLVIQGAIARAKERIATGTPISEAFEMENLFPPLVIRMLKVGETTGALDVALKNISYFYTRDINESIGKVQAMIEPVMSVAMGLILGWIMLAVLGPIYDTIGKIKV
jgi:type IV pilus assembly protein PilC